MHYIGLIICGLLLSFQGVAQKRKPLQQSSFTANKNEAILRFEDLGSELKGDSLVLKFNLSFKGNLVSKGKALHLVPIYKHKGEEIYYPPVLINGSRRQRYYQREQALLSHQAYWEKRPYALMLIDKNREQRLSYRLATILPPALREGKGVLEVAQFVETCCNLRLLDVQPMEVEVGKEPTTLPALSIQPAIQPAVKPASPFRFKVVGQWLSFLRPPKEEVKERNEQLSLYLTYPVNRAEILPGFEQNGRELAKADSVLSRLTKHYQTYTLLSTSIKGFASPEAPFDYNLKLSQRRADGFKTYLLQRYPVLRRYHFFAQGMGEDWEGLTKALEESTLAYKQEMLSIIRFVGLFQGREKQMMDLAGGVPYKHMLQVLFPPLRRMEMDIAYHVRAFTLEEAVEQCRFNPKDLSLEEFYNVAQLLHDARQMETPHTFGETYLLAVRYFPKDPVALINASSVALLRNDLSLAWQYLRGLTKDVRAYNNLGVYYALQGDTTLAKDYFNKAISLTQDKDKALQNLHSLTTK